MNIFEDLGKEVSNPLTILINTSLSFGVFPLKFSKIILVFLKNDHLEYNNFRIIPLLLNITCTPQHVS